MTSSRPLALLTSACLLLTGLVGSVTLAPSAQAGPGDCPADGSSSWTNAAGGSWTVAGNWSNGIPGVGCTVSITLPGTYTVTVPDNEGALGVTLGATSGTQTLQILGNTRSDGSPQGAVLDVRTGGLGVGTHGVLQYTATGANPGEATTTGSAVIVNSGLIRTDTGSLAGTRDIQNSVTNNAGGVIALHANTITCGCGNTHHWINSGTIRTDAGTTSTFSGTAAGVLFSQSTGTFDNQGRAEVAGGYTIDGGTTTGNPIEVCGFVDAPGPGAASFEFQTLPDVGCNGSDGSLTGDVGPLTRILVHATADNTVTSVSTPITNHGTITLDGGPGQAQLISNTVANDGTIELSPASGAPPAFVESTLSNAGTITVPAGPGGYSNQLLTQSGGTIAVSAGGTLQANGGLDLTGGTIANAGQVIERGQLNHTGGSTSGNPVELCGGKLDAPGPGTASFVIGRLTPCDSMGIDGDIGADDSVRVESAGAVLDVFDTAFTNHGHLDLISDTDHLVQLHSGSLTNDGTLTTIGTNIALPVTNSGTWDVPAAPGVSTNVNQPVTQAGGTLQVSGRLNLAGGSALTGGTTTVDGTLDPGGALPLSGGTLQGDGTVTADGAVQNTGGVLRPGHSASPGTLTLAGDYSQSTDGTLAVRVDGASAGSGYARLAVGGTATLAGTLVTTTTTPQNGTLHVLTAASRSGTFEATTSSGQSFIVSYPPAGVDLLGHTASPPQPAPPFTLSQVGFRPTSFRAATGTTLVYRVSAAAQLTVAVTHRVRRRHGHRTRTVTVLRSSTPTTAGRHRVGLHTDRLRPGRYAATVRARDAHGVVRSHVVRLRVLQPRHR